MVKGMLTQQVMQVVAPRCSAATRAARSTERSLREARAAGRDDPRQPGLRDLLAA